MNVLDWTYRLLRWCLGAVFIYAGSLKLLDPWVFAVLIEAYGIVPEGLLMPVAVVLPMIEVAAGIGLLFDIQGSLAAVTALLLLFVAILGYGIHMGLDVDCGCFGPEDLEAKAFHGLRTSLYRDMLMIAVVAALYGWRRYRAVRPVKMMWIVNNRLKRRSTEDAFV
jgi:uncharacterized membrane protein YphA (DoxX/SURF4 family)